MAKHYHFIGIGGIGMSGIAQLLLTRGEKVSGSDVKESSMTRSLEKQGADVFIGHKAANIAGADIIVYSSAIKDDNPEMLEAKARCINIVKRAQALAGLMQDKKVICVAGSHGKTTTTSLVSHMLLEAGLSPTVAIGGNFKNINTNAAAGDGDYFVAEADESDGSFLYYSPLYSIITNIDREHLDHYKTFDSIIAAYKEFIERTGPGGCVFCCGDDENLARICKAYTGRRVTFGLSGKCDIHSRNIRINGLSSVFDCVFKNKPAGTFNLSIGGTHNISNALGVIALGLELGIERRIMERALSTYKGAGRRLDVKLQNRDFVVIDDYAHHPTEIKATLAAVRNLPCRRLIAVFQPHRYSRTKLLMDDFSSCFDMADRVILTDIYAASEQPIPGIDSQCLCDAIKRRAPLKNAVVVSRNELLKYVISFIEPGDILLMLGAGDITRISDELASHISSKI